ncbi:MAG: trypsin-like peptidase domain-containing protein [Planctomycetota bacterium]
MSKWSIRIGFYVGGGACLAILLNVGISSAQLGKGGLDSALEGLPAAVAESALRPEEEHLVKLFEKASRSAVFIINAAIKRSFFLDTSREVEQGNGSGFVWDKKGHIVTNYHVIAGADSIIVGFDSKTSYRARVVGVAADKDLAVLKIDAPARSLYPLSVGRSDNLKVGMMALAIGNPFGLDRSLSKGIISALGREFRSLTGRTITGAIQTDAAINPGNSGGPLLDSGGRLIGVNTTIIGGSSNSGVGFAIPVNTVSRVVGQLIRFGKVKRPALGIYNFSDEQARYLDVEKGVVIRNVAKDSGAETAGLRGIKELRNGRISLGDVIIAVAGEVVDDTDDLLNTLEKFKGGDKVKVKILRDGKEKTVIIKLQEIE